MLIIFPLMSIITNLHIHKFFINMNYDLDNVLGVGNTAVGKHEVSDLMELIL